MGLLRAFCLIAIMISVVVGLLAHMDGTPAAALIPLFFGTAALAAVLPFSACDLARRTRVMRTCILYTVATGLSCIIVIALDVTIVNLATLVAPLAGAALSIWAYRTRHRRRMVGFANYYQK